ncbi:MAG: molybdenum cofactor guanylyltransferase [Armatimonadota bacterium]
MEFSGVVLAGGQSRRFGEDKARYVYKGKALLGWVLEGLQGAAERFVVANRPYPEFGLPVYPDPLPGGDTMSGLHSALAHAKREWVAVAGCDQPFLTVGYWDYLLERARPNLEAVVVSRGEFLEPLGALYHRGLEPLVRERLEQGDFWMQGLLREANAVCLLADDLEARFGPRLFLNANTPEALEPPA